MSRRRAAAVPDAAAPELEPAIEPQVAREAAWAAFWAPVTPMLLTDAELVALERDLVLTAGRPRRPPSQKTST